MQKIFFSFAASLLGISAIFNTPAYAESKFVFPLPEGKILLTNDKAQHDQYLHFPQYSLDFQAAEIPKDIQTNVDLTRCYSYGMPVLAAADGIIEQVNADGGRHVPDSYGSSVSIRHEDGSLSMYGHLIAGSNTPYVQNGDRVKTGQIIGLMGDTGTIESSFSKNPCQEESNYGTHLHFEIRNSKSPNIPPLSPSPQSAFNSGKTYISTTVPLDPGNIYETLHAGKYPFVLKKEVEKLLKPLPPDGNIPTIQEINFITPRPGEWLNLSIVGEHLHDELMVKIEDKRATNQDGECSFQERFIFLSRNMIKLRCRMPLHLGSVASKENRHFSIEVFHKESLRYSTKFDSSYGISGTEMNPRKAVYYTPTRFVITGKNVHRTTVFYIEGCEKKDFKVLEQRYDELVLECLIQPLPNTDLANIKGKSFQHLFLFKTTSRLNAAGENVLSDEEDFGNVVLSGYITMNYDRETRIDSIEPKQVVVGASTKFRVKGNQLPYGKNGTKSPELTLELCPGKDSSKKIEIIPGSYTPYGFDFTCTPEFNTKLEGKSKTAFSLEDLHCDRINLYNWSEAEKNAALEKCYETDDRELKKKSWKYFDTFFRKLAPRKLSVTEKNDHGRTIISQQEVRVISALYEFIKSEEEFQFQFTRKDGDYHINGEPVVSRVTTTAITTRNRQQQISVLGKNLTSDLLIQSDECGQIAVTYGSSEKFELVCLLKKVPLEEIRVVQGSKGRELFKKSRDIIEVYEVEADELSKQADQIQISIAGVNLGPKIKAEAPNCTDLAFNHEPSKTQLYMICRGSWGKFSKPKKIPLKLFTEENFLLFENIIEVQNRGKTFEFLKTENKAKGSSSTEKTQTIPAGTKTISGFDFFGLKCEVSDQQKDFLGSCHFSSSIIAEADVHAFYDRGKEHALILGEFYAGLSKKSKSVNVAGIEFIPLTGEGLISAEIPEKNLLIQGKISGLGINADQVINYPLDITLADYQGTLLLHQPSFDISQARENSKIVIGLGSLQNGQIPAMVQNMTQSMTTIKTLLSNGGKSLASTAAGQNIISAVQNNQTGAGLTPSLKLFQVLELIPETLTFYENYDFVARGTLKTEPFVLKKFGDGADLALKSNLGSFDIDLNAGDGILKVQGSALDSISLFNNDILKTDKSILQAGLTINMKKDDGSVHLDTVKIHLPGNVAEASAEAHITHLFDPENLSASGTIRSAIEVMGLDLARAGAGFRYDPNAVYSIGDQIASGLLQLEAELKLLMLQASGKGLFTFLNNQLVMDMGGAVQLLFLGRDYELADVLSRTRFGVNAINGCYRAHTGSLTFFDPLFGKKISLKGELSLASEVGLDGLLGLRPHFLALSGQASDETRIGFKYDAEQGFFGTFLAFSQACSDVPGQDFLDEMNKALPKPITATKSHLISMLIPPAMAYEDTKDQLPRASWNVEGWQGLQMVGENANEVMIMDQQEQEVLLPPESFRIPGVWKFSDPITYVIHDAEAFQNSGYHFAIRKISTEGSHFEVTTVQGDQKKIETFDVLTFPQQKNLLELDRQIMINGIIISPSKTRRETITAVSLEVRAEISSEKTPTGLNIPPSFPDVYSPSLRQAVEYLAKRGIIEGYSDGRFKPEQTINRAEALKIIFAAQGITPQSPNTPQSFFHDVSNDQWFTPYILEAQQRKIIAGYPDGKYRPDQAVNRAEFTKIAMLAQNSYLPPREPTSALKQYTDLDGSQWYMPFISFALEQGFLETSKKFKPSSGMTRGEAALMIFKILNNPI
jgi:murein DD-endopeptidase MepM/ murein hydrolase activator NlpD